MAEPQPLSFQEWGRQKRGMAGQQIMDNPEGRRRMVDLQRQYDDYMKQFEPATVQTATLPDGSKAAVINGQVVRDTQSRVQFKPVSGKDGKAYNYNPVTGTYAPALIEGTTNQFEMDAKSNALADALAAMAGPQGSAPQESGGFLSGLFGGGPPVTNAPAPMPTPMATPMPTPTPAAAPMTNAPTAMAAPRAFTRDQYKQMTGEDLAPGQYENAKGQPFDIVP
jgi:hypothetical protein